MTRAVRRRVRGLRPQTMRGRLALVATASTAVWVALLTCVVGLLLANRLRGAADELLRTRAEAAATTVDVSPDGLVRVRDAPDDRALDTDVWVFQGDQLVEQPRGHPALRRQAIALAGRGRHYADIDEDPDPDARMYALPLLLRGRQVGTIVTAVDTQPYLRGERAGVLAVLAVGGLLLLTTYPVTRAAVRRAMRPVAEMSDRAARWSADEVSQRFGDEGRPEELAVLSRDLDGLLDRLAAVVRHERRLSAEISHELRTPLARIVAEVDLFEDAAGRSGPAAERWSVAGWG